MTEMTVTAAGPEDIEALAELLAEMDRFYGATEVDPLEERVRQIREALFSAPAAASVLLARDDAELAGFAAYSFLWPAVGLTRSLYLKELYVAGQYRRRGVARQLMSALLDVASQHGCSRVEWTTDTGNDGALAFYDDLGVPVNKGKVFYRVEDTGDGLLTAF